MKRGDIVFVRNERSNCTGSEQTNTRPAVVVSNDKCNCYSPVIEVVYTTTQRKKKDLPTHVFLHSTPRPSIALCEAVYSVDKSRIMEMVGKCTTNEMLKINRALKVSLGLT